jgi:hypothetical protein
VTGWVIVILHDGLARLELFGDADGQPFPSQQAAEAHAQVFPRRGASYSVYVQPIGRG